jgi:hypothetical protein
MEARDPDQIIRGADKIGEIAGILEADNKTVDIRATYYKLNAGLIDATKNGRDWVSTPARIRKSVLGA